MASQWAIQDQNKFPAILGHSGTENSAETRRIVVDANGAVTVSGTVTTTGSGTSPVTIVGTVPVTIENTLITDPYDYVAVTYPSGTTEVYSFKNGGSVGTNVGTITLTYLDSAKGSLSLVQRT